MQKWILFWTSSLLGLIAGGMFYLYTSPQLSERQLSERQLHEIEMHKRELHKDDYKSSKRPEEPQPDPIERARQIGVLYATNRTIAVQYDAGPVPLEQITYKRSDELKFGSAIVRVPDIHTIGVVERPAEVVIFGFTLYKGAEDEKSHFTMKDLEVITRDEALKIMLASQRQGAMVFVHGYNTSFEDSIFKTAQLAFDAGFAGLPIAFSWPSMHSLGGYDYDRESAAYSWDALLDLLYMIQEEAHVSDVYVVAHSMGNQILLDALTHVEPTRGSLKLSEVIMAAPDVDRDVFLKRLDQLKLVSDGLTLYASSADKAMLASRLKAEGVRAGDIGEDGPVIAPGLETIDVTSLGDDLLALNHGTFSSNKFLIDDIGRLMRIGTHPPAARWPQLVGVPTSPPTKYWMYPKTIAQ
jgi:esterase/lipase superfamily enzyme